MTKILFVCHGNICRSPMAEFVLRTMAKRAGVADQLEVASAATSTEELGNPVYPPVQRLLSQHGIDCTGKVSRLLTAHDLQRYDLLIGMDHANLRNMQRICGPDPDGKIRLMMTFAGEGGEVADPWYTRDFEATWRDVVRACRGLLAQCFPALCAQDITL